MTSPRFATLLGGTVAFVALGGCLSASDGHCLFAGGDYGPSIERDAICIVPKTDVDEARGDQLGHYRLVDGEDRATAEPPRGYLRARFGMPLYPGTPEETDLRSVHGVLTQATAYSGASGCIPDEAALGAVWRETQGDFGRFHEITDGRSVARRSAVAVPVEALARLDEVLLGELERCLEQLLDSGTASTDVTTDPDATTDGSSTDTGQADCTSTADCSIDVPYCDADGTCRPCDAAPDPTRADQACAAAREDTPVCSDGACVQCTPENALACGGQAPICGEDESCGPCTEHDQCSPAACNLFSGACLPNTPQTVVTVGAFGGDFSTLAAAVAAYPPRAEGMTIIVTDLTPYREEVIVDGGKTIAFLAEDGSVPVWGDPAVGVVNNRQLSVFDATVLVEGVHILDNDSNAVRAVHVSGGRLWLDRTRVSTNAGGNVWIGNDGTLFARNSFLGDGTTTMPAIQVQASQATILYSTVGGGSSPVTAISCSESTVELRNSFVVAAAGVSEIQCPGAVIESTATEMVIGGTNVTLGSMDAAWFIDFAGGDFHLSAQAPAALATAAQWQSGDPRVDIDGTEIRPAGPDDADHAGADVP